MKFGLFIFVFLHFSLSQFSDLNTGFKLGYHEQGKIELGLLNISYKSKGHDFTYNGQTISIDFYNDKIKAYRFAYFTSWALMLINTEIGLNYFTENNSIALRPSLKIVGFNFSYFISLSKNVPKNYSNFQVSFELLFPFEDFR